MKWQLFLAWLLGAVMVLAALSLFSFSDGLESRLTDSESIHGRDGTSDLPHAAVVLGDSSSDEELERLRTENDRLLLERHALREQAAALQADLESARQEIHALDARTATETLLEELSPKNIRLLNKARTTAKIREDRAWRIHELTKFTGSEKVAIDIMRLIFAGHRLDAGNFQDLVDVAGDEVAQKIALALRDCPPIPGTVPGVDTSEAFFDFFEDNGIRYLDHLTIFVRNSRPPIGSVSFEDNEARILRKRVAAENAFESKEAR